MKHKPRAAARGVAALDALAHKRGVFAPLVGEIAAAFAARFAGAGAAVEIGSGLGALHAWLTSDVRARLVETEPLAEAAGALGARHGRVLRASADRLPFAQGIAAVLGLDVLDELPAPAAARDEIRRVLGPGGHLIHILDLSPNLDTLFASLDDRNELPLPNFLGDAIATGLVPIADAPPLRLEDDLLIAPRHQLWKIAASLRAAGHPLARPLVAYLDPFSPDVFDAADARAHFLALAGDARAARTLTSTLLSVYSTTRLPAYRAELPLELRAIATYEMFARRLRDLYTPAHGFEIAHDALVSVRRDAGGPAGFTGRWVGRTVHLPRAPDAVTGVPLDDGAAAADAPSIVEAGAHVFVARRI